MLVDLAKLIKPKNRLREVDKEKVNELANSIKVAGLLQPILIMPDHTIIAGMHRYLACKKLGLEQVPVTIRGRADDKLNQRYMEMAENRIRSDLSPSEWDQHTVFMCKYEELLAFTDGVGKAMHAWRVAVKERTQIELDGKDPEKYKRAKQKVQRTATAMRVALKIRTVLYGGDVRACTGKSNFDIDVMVERIDRIHEIKKLTNAKIEKALDDDIAAMGVRVPFDIKKIFLEETEELKADLEERFEIKLDERFEIVTDTTFGVNSPKSGISSKTGKKKPPPAEGVDSRGAASVIKEAQVEALSKTADKCSNETTKEERLRDVRQTLAMHEKQKAFDINDSPVMNRLAQRERKKLVDLFTSDKKLGHAVHQELLNDSKLKTISAVLDNTEVATAKQYKDNVLRAYSKAVEYLKSIGIEADISQVTILQLVEAFDNEVVPQCKQKEEERKQLLIEMYPLPEEGESESESESEAEHEPS